MITSEVIPFVGATNVQSIWLKTGKINIDQHSCIPEDITPRLCCH
jgi:hypothetical protein